MILEEIKPQLKNRWPDELIEAEGRFAAADWPAADQAFDTALKRYPDRPEVQRTRHATARGRGTSTRPSASSATSRVRQISPGSSPSSRPGGPTS